MDRWMGQSGPRQRRRLQVMDGLPEWRGYGAMFKKRGPANKQRLDKGTPKASSIFADRCVPRVHARVNIDIDTYIIIAGGKCPTRQYPMYSSRPEANLQGTRARGSQVSLPIPERENPYYS